MSYDSAKPSNDGFLANAPQELRTNQEGLRTGQIVDAGTVKGLTPGNAAGQIPISNGTQCVGLNAEKVGGNLPSAFAPAAHNHAVATSSSNGFMANTDKAKLDSVATGAEINQNAFANVLVGGTTVQADSKTDTLEMIAGQNIAITPDAANDKITIAISGKVPSAAIADNATTVGGNLPSAFAPNTHKVQHTTGGSDALSPSDIGAAPILNPSFASKVSITGTSPYMQLTPSGWGASYAYVQAGVNTTGTNIGDCAMFFVPPGKAFTFTSGSNCLFAINPDGSITSGVITTTGTGCTGSSAPSMVLANTTSGTGKIIVLNSMDSGGFQVYDANSSTTLLSLKSSDKTGYLGSDKIVTQGANNTFTGANEIYGNGYLYLPQKGNQSALTFNSDGAYYVGLTGGVNNLKMNLYHDASGLPAQLVTSKTIATTDQIAGKLITEYIVPSTCNQFTISGLDFVNCHCYEIELQVLGISGTSGILSILPSSDSFTTNNFHNYFRDLGYGAVSSTGSWHPVCVVSAPGGSGDQPRNWSKAKITINMTSSGKMFIESTAFDWYFTQSFSSSTNINNYTNSNVTGITIFTMDFNTGSVYGNSNINGIGAGSIIKVYQKG